MNEKKIWMAVGLIILLLLVVTTPGWQDVLGLNFEFDLGKYMPAILLLGFMAALIGFVLIGGEKGEG